jgi:hypothetical protein
MKIDEIMELDYRDESQKVKLMKCIRSFKPFSKYEESEIIPMELIEEYMDRIFKKYKCGIGYVFRANARANLGEPKIWSCSIKEKTGGVYLCTVHAVTLYEAFIKLAIRLHYAAKNGEIQERSTTGEKVIK